MMEAEIEVLFKPKIAQDDKKQHKKLGRGKEGFCSMALSTT